MLVVDLDHTLIRTDSTYEAFVLLLKHRPWSALKLPYWAWRGKAHTKFELGQRVMIDAEVLPYNQSVLDAARRHRNAGGKTVLATAATDRHAQAVAEHLGCFDAVVASTKQTNVYGPIKRDLIVQAIKELPPNAPSKETATDCDPAFDFIGDAQGDIDTWVAAGRAMVVDPSRQLEAQIRPKVPIERIIRTPQRQLRAAIRAIRPQQWAKNILVFIPLLASHELNDASAWINCVLAFLCFSLAASSIYLLNDLFDLDSDRYHHSKHKRPFAAGDLPLRTGLALASVLMPAAVVLAAFALPKGFLALLLLYLFVTNAYSIHLKRKPILDVLCLAGLYTLRVFAGGTASDHDPSPWLLGFSMFMFVSLAFAKRYTELDALRLRQDPNDPPDTTARGRGYQVSDLDMVRVLGPMNGFLAVLVFCLYAFDSGNAQDLYANQKLLWLIAPIMLYWISRVWLLAARGKLDEDPVVFALKDLHSYFAGLLIAILAILATIG